MISTSDSRPPSSSSSLSLLGKGAIPSAPYSYRPPSPPFIQIPVLQRAKPGADRNPLDLVPSYDHVDSSQLTSQDLAIITRNVTQIATDRAGAWEYEQRREAQPILDFLYLGPTAVIRDHAFLRREGITMVLVVRDSRLANRSLLSVDNATAALGISAHYLDVDAQRQLINCFTQSTRLINDHLLAVYHSQAQGRNDAGQMFVQADGFRRGKVLIACETGNDDSAALVAAYVMAMFGTDLVTTLQFVNIQRFCCGFNERTKRVLLAWQDIVRARSEVAMHSRTQQTGRAEYQPSVLKTEVKRNLDAMLNTAEDADLAAPDHERFQDRATFVPFVDVNY